VETREFAERVLFSTSLEEKLTSVRGLTDHEPGAVLGVPGEPGRPVDLRLRKDGVRAGFPGDSKLLDEEQRGVLLHFFANHELLATELMALVLLKFPEAPTDFRQGIVQTLKEEQLHTKWYLRRMEECGVRFGDFPLNRFFWDCIAPMETPLDYVTRLSLTFEQANLDYAHHYARILREAGDEKTSRILSRIYQDEIGHVGYGLKWFRRWKAAGQSDWDAYRHQLPFPLSPARGRGNVPFNAGGRLQAGLGEDFVREMEVFSRSKGRTPNVYWFTPDAEAAMAHGLDGRGFSPRKEVEQLAFDLDPLPIFLARRDDVVLLRQQPSPAHLRKLHDHGFEIPELEILSASGQIRDDSLQRSRKLNELRPWAWCPQSARLLSALGGERVRWQEATRQLFSKARQAEDLAMDSSVCRSDEDVLQAVHGLKSRGCLELVAKSPFGAAGQKNQKFTDLETARPWILRVLERQGRILIEPWFDRVFDFSVQYEMGEAGLRRLAYVQLENDRRGQFQACVVRGKFCRNISSEIAKFLMGGALTTYEAQTAKKLEDWLRAASYQGPVGVDAFVHRLMDGSLALRPIVEVNPRFTMGRLTWELQRRVTPGRTVRFELIRVKDPEARVKALEEAHPVTLGKDGRLASGTLVLNEPKAVLAVLTVG
jgi:uncharacterized ferritin-like protein (DUF455 family)